MLRNGASVEEVVSRAIDLSREAFQRLTCLERTLDQTFGSPEFRRSTIDPLLAKERQIDSIRARARRGGSIRTSDTDNLQSLLGRTIKEYEDLSEEFPWTQLQLANRRLVSSYIEERRNHLQLGDSERVKAAYLELLNEQPLAS